MAQVVTPIFRGADELAKNVFTALRDAREFYIAPEPSASDNDVASVLKQSDAMRRVDFLMSAIKVHSYITYVSRLGANESPEVQSSLHFWTSRADNKTLCDIATLSAHELQSKYPNGVFNGAVSVDDLKSIAAMRNALGISMKDDLLARFIEDEKKHINPEAMGLLAARLNDVQFVSNLATNYAVIAIARGVAAVVGIDDARPLMEGIGCTRNIRTWAIGWKPITPRMSGIDYNFQGMHRELAVKSLAALNKVVETLRAMPTRSGVVYQQILARPSAGLS